MQEEEEEEEQEGSLDRDDLSNIQADDPIDAVLKIENKIRPSLPDGVRTTDEVAIVNRYYQMMKHACYLFEVPFEINDLQEADGASEGNKLFYLVKTEMDKRRLDRLHSTMKMKETVILNENWREKIHAYLANVRNIVQRANIPDALRDGIMRKLHALDAEVDRTRTRVQQITEVLVELCKGVSAGAEELKPAVSLFERVVGAVARLAPSPQQVPTLPAPETLGLPPPDATE